MLKEITVPNIGDFKNVDIIEILVKPGDVIKKDQTLMTLETDKAVMDIPSSEEGVVKEIKVSVGSKVSQGDLIITLEAGDNTAAESNKAQLSTPTTPSTPKQDIPKQAESLKSESSSSSPSSLSNQSESSQIKPITVPNIGDFKGVEVIEVLVKPGDVIKKDQALITLETDKAAMEVPSPEAGTVKSIKVSVGSKVSQGDIILELESVSPGFIATTVSDNKNNINTETSSAPKQSKLEPSSNTAHLSIAESGAVVQKENQTSELIQSNKPVHAGPATRRLAYELGIDLSELTGTGQKGRVLRTDIHEYVKNKLKNIKNNITGSGLGLEIEPMPQIDFSQWGEIQAQPLKRIQKLSAKFLHRNWVSIPHVTNFDEADITELEAFRQETNLQAEKIGVKLTPLVFLMKSVVSALKLYPEFNSSLSPDGQTLILKHYFNIGVAVDTPDGLVVPVIRHVDQKGIYDLAKELTELSMKARSGKLMGSEMQGGCFTLSSLGGIGGTNFTPIINAPEVAILGISKSALKPVYRNGTLEPRLLLPLSLSYDHRVIDGAKAARFLASITAQLSDIRMLLL